MSGNGDPAAAILGLAASALIVPGAEPAPPAEAPPREPLGVIVARHLGTTILMRVDREVESYLARNRIANPREVRANIASNKDNTLIVITLSHEVNGLAIVGTPRRKFSIQLLMGV